MMISSVRARTSEERTLIHSQAVWKLAVTRKKAEPYQATSERLWKESVIWGMAVAMIV